MADTLPFDELNEYVYYTKCLLIAIYSSYVLFHCFKEVVFQSAQIQT
jgi:hypothetical protein